jgi:hypothetical protein
VSVAYIKEKSRKRTSSTNLVPTPEPPPSEHNTDGRNTVNPHNPIPDEHSNPLDVRQNYQLPQVEGYSMTPLNYRRRYTDTTPISPQTAIEWYPVCNHAKCLSNFCRHQHRRIGIIRQDRFRCQCVQPRMSTLKTKFDNTKNIYLQRCT